MAIKGLKNEFFLFIYKIIDAITGTIIATLITSAVNLFVGILTHVKSSKCGSIDVEFNNTTASTSPTTTTNSK